MTTTTTLNMSAKPARMSMVNLVTEEEMEAQFNPTELEELLGANWADLALLGGSYMPSQFNQTDNYEPSFELAFRAFDDDGDRLDDILDARRFLMSLVYPSRSGTTVATGAPPRVLFVWPTLISVTCSIRRVAFKHTLFNINATPIHFAAKITLKEIRDVQLYSEDVRQQGTMRSVGGGPT